MNTWPQALLAKLNPTLKESTRRVSRDGRGMIAYVMEIPRYEYERQCAELTHAEYEAIKNQTTAALESLGVVAYVIESAVDESGFPKCSASYRAEFGFTQLLAT